MAMCTGISIDTETRKENTAKKFTRDDLKSGYVVKLRNGELRMVVRAGRFTKVLVNQSGDWAYLSSNWGDNLKRVDLYKHCHHERVPAKSQDIVAIYGLVKSTEHYGEALLCSIDHRPLLWTRTPAVKMTLEEVSEKLGFEVEIISNPDDFEKLED